MARRHSAILLVLVTSAALATLSRARLGSNCSEWNSVYGKQWWADEAEECRQTEAGNATNIIGAGTQYCCRLYARLNAAFMFFLSPIPDGLACGVKDEEQRMIYARLYYRNCRDFAQTPLLPCPVCNDTANGTIPAASASPSPQPENLIDPVPVMPTTTASSSPSPSVNATVDNDDTATNETDNGDDGSTSNGTSGSGTAESGGGGVNGVNLGDGSESSTSAVGEASDSARRICLHGSMRVQLEGGRSVRIDALRTGDRVEGSGEIYIFSHNSRERAEFVNMTTSSGLWLAATPGHLIHTPKGLVSAGEMKVGDTLDGGHKVVLVRRLSDVGVYNPHTIRGDIIVNGLRASTYTVHVQHRAAHGALAIFRTLWRALRYHTTLLHCGVPSLSSVTGGACTA